MTELQLHPIVNINLTNNIVRKKHVTEDFILRDATFCKALSKSKKKLLRLHIYVVQLFLE